MKRFRRIGCVHIPLFPIAVAAQSAAEAGELTPEAVAEAVVETPEPAVESKEADTQDTPVAPAPTFSKTASTRIS